jgi:hypothetical protein
VGEAAARRKAPCEDSCGEMHVFLCNPRARGPADNPSPIAPHQLGAKRPNALSLSWLTRPVFNMNEPTTIVIAQSVQVITEPVPCAPHRFVVLRRWKRAPKKGGRGHAVLRLNAGQVFDDNMEETQVCQIARGRREVRRALAAAPSA